MRKEQWQSPGRMKFRRMWISNEYRSKKTKPTSAWEEGGWQLTAIHAKSSFYFGEHDGIKLLQGGLNPLFKEAREKQGSLAAGQLKKESQAINVKEVYLFSSPQRISKVYESWKQCCRGALVGHRANCGDNQEKLGQEIVTTLNASCLGRRRSRRLCSNNPSRRQTKLYHYGHGNQPIVVAFAGHCIHCICSNHWQFILSN